MKREFIYNLCINKGMLKKNMLQTKQIETRCNDHLKKINKTMIVILIKNNELKSYNLV